MNLRVSHRLLVVGAVIAVALLLAVLRWVGRPPEAPTPVPAAPDVETRSRSAPASTPARSATVPAVAEPSLGRLREWLRSGGGDPKLLRRELGRLARSTDPEALEVLQAALASGQPQIRALAALILGQSAFPEAAALLRPLLLDPQAEVVCAAVAALADVDLAALRQWGLPALDDGGLPTIVQAEVLMALARHGDEAAIARAMAVAVDGTDAALVTAMLERANGLSPDVAVPLCQAVVTAPQSTAEARGEAFEALSDVAVPEAAALLLEYATHRPVASERRQAAEALGTIPETAVRCGDVLTALAAETDPQTRVHLYDALRNLTQPDPALLLSAIRDEADAQTRTAALLTAGSLLGEGKADAAMQAYFDGEGIRILEESALASGLAPDYRMRAVSALRNAGTAAARAALARLAQSDDAAIRRLAARPLPRRP